LEVVITHGRLNADTLVDHLPWFGCFQDTSDPALGDTHVLEVQEHLQNVLPAEGVRLYESRPVLLVEPL
jgi:hypothetical protein